MKKLAKLMSAGLALGMGLSIGIAATPAFAQESGRANTAEDFNSADSQEGFLGSNVDIWDLFHRAGSLNGAGVVDDGFYRTQNRQINRQAESLRERQRAILEQRAAEEAAASPVEATPQ
jgi:hypothetical protein